MSPFDEGAELFETEQELLAAEVWRRAAKLYPDHLDTQRDFVNGYITRRLRRDEFHQEKKSAP